MMHVMFRFPEAALQRCSLLQSLFGMGVSCKFTAYFQKTLF